MAVVVLRTLYRWQCRIPSTCHYTTPATDIARAEDYGATHRVLFRKHLGGLRPVLDCKVLDHEGTISLGQWLKSN